MKKQLSRPGPKKRRRPALHSPTAGFSPVWLLLILVTLSNAALSYALIPTAVKCFLFLFGILAPLYALSRMKRNEKPRENLPLCQQEFFEAIPSWAWLSVLAGAVLLRFWKLDSLFLWPTGDEGLIGSSAIALSRQWDWRFFYTIGQNPPAFVWLCALFFKWVPSALFDLWAPAALVSFLMVVVGLAAGGRAFSKSYAFLFACLLAFSYWPLYIGRRCLPAVSVPLGELVLFSALAGFLKSKEENKWKWAFGAGLCAGLQCFTYVAWPVVTLSGGLLFWTGVLGQKKKIRLVGAFSGGALLALLPFLAAVLREGYGQHISNLTLWSGWFHDRNPLLNILTYLKALFWDFTTDPQAPAQGGLLNPLLTTLFFWGCVELLPLSRTAWVRWCGASFVLFLLPGVFSLNLQTFRVIQLLPLVLAVAALGAARLASRLPRPGRFWVLSGLLLVSTLWDFARLALPYGDVQHRPQGFLSTGKSLARFRASQALKEQENREGPGFILGEWDIPSDRTLFTAEYFSNCLDQPPAPGVHPQWLAVMADAHYRPFLAKRFPYARWLALDEDFSANGTRMLGLLPLTPQNRKDLLAWILADHAMGDLNWAIDHLYDKGCLDWMDLKIRQDYPLVRGDPFLESVFWEKVAYFYYYYGNHFAQHLEALKRAVERGYPAAHLYAQLGELYALSRQPGLAGQADEKARESAARYPWHSNP